MNCKTSKKWNNGFTLVEMLAVTAIVVILLTVGMVAVVHYARWLRITELDNSAREIYLAAENRAALLSASGQLEAQVKNAGGDDQKLDLPAEAKDATPLSAGGGTAQAAEVRYIYYNSTTGEAVLEKLLPEGTIDPALRKGCFYVVYKVESKSGAGSVTDVFYADEKDSFLYTVTNFGEFYQEWKGSSREKRLDKKFGYYGGEAAENGTSDSLKAPIIRVINGEELVVELTYEVPTTLPPGETRTPQVWLYYGENREFGVNLVEGYTKANAPAPGRYTEVEQKDWINGVVTYTRTWVLDTLKEGGQQFKNLKFLSKSGEEYINSGTPGSFGGDFVVEALIKSDTVYSATASDTGNSLFASRKEEKDGNGPTAYIENLRHLQNLYKKFSGVGGKTAAVQIDDIEQSTSGLDYYRDYEFKPIENFELKSYCGSHGVEGAGTVTHFIKGLNVTPASADGRSGGLFSTVLDDDDDDKDSLWKFKDVRLINTHVKALEESAGRSLPAGALVGSAADASFENCWVYWEGEELEQLKDAVGEKPEQDQYQVIGSIAGGLVGELHSGTITNCLAATLVDGSSIAGGLVGRTMGTVEISRSYADCYLTGEITIGGLIGEAERGGTSGSITLNNVYTAGFIYAEKAKKAAGVCNCEGTITGTNVYSAMQYLDLPDDILTPGVPSNGGTTATNCYYLEGPSTDADAKKSYAEMAGDDFLNTMGGAFERKNFDQSSPYNLLEELALTVYPFPGLAGLPHYGDWNSKFIKPALVYYEQYQMEDGTVEHGFYGGGAANHLRDDCVVPLDGYAVAFREDDLKDLGITGDADVLGIAFTYDVSGGTADKTGTYKKSELYAVSYPDPETGDEETIYLALLPDEAINSGYATEDFFQTVSFTAQKEGVEGKSVSEAAAYSPHFAKTAVPMSDMSPEQRQASIESMGKRVQTYVRTPRHLRALSEFEEYYHTTADRLHSFRQELDLDYAAYTGYDWRVDGNQNQEKLIQDPIGRFGAPFNGVYNGGRHTIEGVEFRLPGERSRQYAGLFGLSAGTLQDIVYLMNPEKTVSVTRSGVTLHLGGLAGGNSGTIQNCAVAGASLYGGIYNQATAYVGGLVGSNAGTIRNCAAEVASLKAYGADFSTAYAGGLVGQNNASGGSGIFTSYAVGHVSGEVIRDSEARVCGFVGYNSGHIEYSYSATWLESSGTGVEVYGFCGERRGTQKGNYFVDKGNFTYRGEPYNGTYSTGKETATPISYGVMTGTPPALGGMAEEGRAAHDGNLNKDGTPVGTFPLPTGVKDRNGQPVHYGQWPEALDLGDMGMYYWEKMKLPGGNGVREIYGISLLKVDAGKKEVTNISTLSNARSDGGVVVDYGYGFYCSKGMAEQVEVSTTGVHYTKDGATVSVQDQWGGWHEDLVWNGTVLKNLSEDTMDTKVNESLNQMMEEYSFFSYHSFVPNPSPNLSEGEKTYIRDGLYPAPSNFNDVLDRRPNVVVNMTLGGGKGDPNSVKVMFRFNPHFANALSVEAVGAATDKGEEIAAGWQVNSLDKEPGTRERPYEIRAVSQLSAINWNSANKDTKTVMVGETRTVGNNRKVDFQDNTKQFFYLSRSTDPDQYNGGYFWKQTHDINGNGGVYTPIAEYYTVYKSGKLNGWFGGTFDGDDYVIENVNIQGQTSSVAGLFGVVLDGTLENIVLYSSDGKGYVTADFDTGTMLSVDYYMGTLAGLAATTADNKTATIRNCSASGYTINYKTYNVIDNMLGVGKQSGGSGVGGLLGASYMTLENCSAVTTIRILANSENVHGNDNTRAGGLVGIAKRNITNCYAGGEITVGGTLDADGSWNKDGGVVRVKARNGVFLGGIVSGNYFETLGKIDGGGAIALNNCYSYVKLPSQSETRIESTTTEDGTTTNPTSIRGLYAVGGSGDAGDCTITNCYYLESEVMKHNREGFDTTADFYGGNGYSFTLRTDIASNNDSVVQVVTVKNEAGNDVQKELRRPLTSDDVGKLFLIDRATYNDQYKKTVNGKVVYCPYFEHSITEGLPIFTFVNDPGDATHNGKQMVEFMGWVVKVTPGVPDEIIELTTDPAALSGWSWSGPKAITYKELSGENEAFGIYGKLNKDIPEAGKKFSPVTDTEDGFSVPGKYSYGAAAGLTGLRYPFPTILTREGGRIHVHYGDWPLNGIEREHGREPIHLDLLRDGQDTKTDTLTLSADVPKGGTWKIMSVGKAPAEGEEPEQPKVKAYFGDSEDSTEFTDTDGTCRLTVQGLVPGLTTVTVAYEKDGKSYCDPIDVPVQVTAALRVKPEFSPIYVFPGSKTVVPLVLCDDEGNRLTPAKLADVEIDLDKSICKWPDLLSGAKLEWNGAGGYYYLLLDAVDDQEKAGGDLEAMPVSVSYTYKGTAIDAEISTLSVQMKALPEAVTDKDTGVTRITFPAIPLDEKDAEGNEITAVTVVTDAVDVNAQTAAPGGAGEPARKVSAGDNAVLLEGYATGDAVTLSLKLEMKRSDDMAGKPTLHNVEMTVTIPEPADTGETGSGTEGSNGEKAGPGTERAEPQEAVQDAVPEPEAAQEAEAPKEPEPALPVEEKTDPDPEEEDGSGGAKPEPEPEQ